MERLRLWRYQPVTAMGCTEYRDDERYQLVSSRSLALPYDYGGYTEVAPRPKTHTGSLERQTAPTMEAISGVTKQ
jgi:hypothetical protein